MRAVLVPLPCGVHELATVFLFRPSPKAALNPKINQSDTCYLCTSCVENGRYVTSFSTESPSSSPSGCCLSLPLALTSGVSGLRGLERRARMGNHGQTATARGLMLRESLLPYTDEVIPCRRV